MGHFRVLHLHAVHGQLFRIILTNKEYPLRIEREVSSSASRYLYKCC